MAGVSLFRMATRLGFAARGLMYAAIGYLTLRSGRTEDPGGILAYLAGETGKPIVAAMAAGFIAYGFWRLLEAWCDSEGHGSEAKGVLVRFAGAASGFIHLGLGVAAVLVASGDRGGDGDASEAGAATALGLPGGSLLLYAIATALIVTGLYQLRKGWTLDFLRHLEPSAARLAWVAWLGRLGHLARGVVFALIGWFCLEAARAQSSSTAGGIDQALKSLPASLQAAVAGGLMLFGLFSLVEARYRRIADPRAFGRPIAGHR